MATVSDDATKACIAANLARLCAERSWSLNEVARRCDSYPTTIKEIRDGSRMPGVGLLTRIADAFEVNVGEFLKKCPPPKKSA